MTNPSPSQTITHTIQVLCAIHDTPLVVHVEDTVVSNALVTKSIIVVPCGYCIATAFNKGLNRAQLVHDLDEKGGSAVSQLEEEKELSNIIASFEEDEDEEEDEESLSLEEPDEEEEEDE